MSDAPPPGPAEPLDMDIPAVGITAEQLAFMHDHIRAWERWSCEVEEALRSTAGELRSAILESDRMGTPGLVKAFPVKAALFTIDKLLAGMDEVKRG